MYFCICYFGHKSIYSFHHSSSIFRFISNQNRDQCASSTRSFVKHGTLTKEILCCAFLPLFKGGFKNPAKIDSYRAVAGASQLLKLFEYVILLLLGHLLSSDSLQFGFKEGVSTTQCSWMVYEVCKYYINRGGVVNAHFMDLSKAFDKILFNDTLFSNSWSRFKLDS